MARTLHLRFLPEPTAEAPELRDAWTLRRTLLETAPAERDDWAAFTSHACGGDRALLSFVDREERLGGFFTVGLVPVDELPRALVLVSKYFYFRAEYRGHPLTLLAPYRAIVWALGRYGWRRMFFATTAFPHSYCSLARSTGELRSLRDPDLPLPVRRALLAFCEAFHPDDFDREAGLVQSRSVPQGIGEGRSARTRALSARYERLNPRWRDGLALPVVFPVTPRVMAHALLQLLSRSVARPFR